MTDQALSLWHGVLDVPMRTSAATILHETALEHGLTTRSLLAADRRRHIVRARWDAMARLRDTPKPGGQRRSLPEIAAIMGGLDHTTVLHGIRALAALRLAEREAGAA